MYFVYDVAAWCTRRCRSRSLSSVVPKNLALALALVGFGFVIFVIFVVVFVFVVVGAWIERGRGRGRGGTTGDGNVPHSASLSFISESYSCIERCQRATVMRISCSA
jgi:hypothetical protein